MTASHPAWHASGGRAARRLPPRGLRPVFSLSNLRVRRLGRLPNEHAEMFQGIYIYIAELDEFHLVFSEYVTHYVITYFASFFWPPPITMRK